MGANLRMIMAGVFIASLIAAYTGGRFHQISIYNAKQATAEIAGFEKAAALEIELVAKVAELKDKSNQLEELARATPPNTNVCLPASRVRRLNLR